MQMQKLLTFFSKHISVYVIFNDQSFNDTLTNDIVSFEQLGSAYHHAVNTVSLASSKLKTHREVCSYFRISIVKVMQIFRVYTVPGP